MALVTARSPAVFASCGPARGRSRSTYDAGTAITSFFLPLLLLVTLPSRSVASGPRVAARPGARSEGVRPVAPGRRAGTPGAGGRKAHAVRVARRPTPFEFARTRVGEADSRAISAKQAGMEPTLHSSPYQSRDAPSTRANARAVPGADGSDPSREPVGWSRILRRLPAFRTLPLKPGPGRAGIHAHSIWVRCRSWITRTAIHAQLPVAPGINPGTQAQRL